MKPEIYENCALSVNGGLIADMTDVAVEWVDSDEQFHVLAGGGGRTLIQSPGARYVKISFSVAVKKYADEFDHIQQYLDAEQVGLTVYTLGSGMTLSTTGWFLAPSVTAAVGQNMALKLTFCGEAKPWR
jgi:hypothetical protein